MIYWLSSVFYVGDKRVRYDCSAISGPLDMLAGLAENNWLEALEFVWPLWWFQFFLKSWTYDLSTPFSIGQNCNCRVPSPWQWSQSLLDTVFVEWYIFHYIYTYLIVSEAKLIILLVILITSALIRMNPWSVNIVLFQYALQCDCFVVDLYIIVLCCRSGLWYCSWWYRDSISFVLLRQVRSCSSWAVI